MAALTQAGGRAGRGTRIAITSRAHNRQQRTCTQSAAAAAAERTQQNSSRGVWGGGGRGWSGGTSPRASLRPGAAASDGEGDQTTSGGHVAGFDWLSPAVSRRAAARLPPLSLTARTGRAAAQFHCFTALDFVHWRRPRRRRGRGTSASLSLSAQLSVTRLRRLVTSRLHGWNRLHRRNRLHR